MTAQDKAAPAASAATVDALWRALLHTLLAKLSDGSTVRASMLLVTRNFLRDNGISVRTVAGSRAGLAALEELDRKFDA